MSRFTPDGPVQFAEPDGVTPERTRRPIASFQWSNLAMLILYRMVRNRDVKIIVTSKGNTTGLGKTTLAMYLCRTLERMNMDLFGVDVTNPHEYRGWSADESAFIQAWPYIEAYKETERPGRCFLFDEIEIDMDNRRSMTTRQVVMSQAWQKLRYKNVVTIATAPGIHQLDKRVPENTDIWINVMGQGRAYVYYLTMFSDWEGFLQPKRLKKAGLRESIVWLPPENTDSDMAYLNEMKDDTEFTESRSGDGVSKSELNETLTEQRETILRRLVSMDLDLSQTEMGELIPDGDGGSMSQSWVSQKIRELDL